MSTCKLEETTQNHNEARKKAATLNKKKIKDISIINVCANNKKGDLRGDWLVIHIKIKMNLINWQEWN